MSIASEITRLQGNRNTIRAQLITWGVAESTDTLADLATTISGISKQTVNYTLDATTKTDNVLSNTSYTIPAGYHDGTGIVSIQVESKEVTPAATAQTVTPQPGRVLSAVTVAAIPSQHSAITQVLDLTTQSITIPAGYYSAASTVSISPQTLTITPSIASAAGTDTYIPSAGEVYGVITVNKVVSQSKTAVLQIDDGINHSDLIEPDEGKVLSSVIVPRITTESQEVTAGTSAITVNPSEVGKYLSQVTVLPTPTETKTVNWAYVDVANGITSDTYTPASGKYFSAFTVNRVDNKYQDISGVTATASDVLITKKFVANDGTLTDGTMPNNGSVSQTLTPATQSYTIPAGYHDGTGTVSIFPEIIDVDPADTAQTITPTDATKVISQVTISPITYSAAPSITLSYGNLTASTAKGRYQAGSDNITLSSTGLTGKAEHVLAGYQVIGLNSLGTAADSLVGTIPNNGAGGTYVLDATQANNEYTNLSKTFAAGYWSSANTVSISPATATVTPGTSAQTLTPVSGSVYTKVEVAAIPIIPLTNSIISGQAVIESEAGQTTDYKWVTTVDIPAGYHEAQVLTKDFSSIFPALDPAAAAAEMLSGYQAYDKDGKILTGTMPNNEAGSTITLSIGSQSHTFAAGYWSSANTVQIIPEQIEQAADPDQALVITPTAGMVLSQVTIPKISAGALSAGAGSVSVTGNNSLTLGTAVSSAPASGYYLTAAGSGTVGVGTAGWLKTTASQTSNTQTLYYPIATAALTLDATVPSGTSPVEVGFNHTVKIAAGYYHEDRYLSAGVDQGSATTPTETIDVTVGAPSWDSINGTFMTTASGSKSIAPLVVAGYVDQGIAGTISASGSRNLGVVTVGASLSETTGKITPVIAKASVPSGVVDVSNGAITTEAPASGKYVAVSAAAISRTVTVTPKVTGAGYGTTSHSNGPASNPTIDAGTNASGTYYIPVASGSATTPTETVDVTVGAPSWNSTNETFITTASGSRSITPIVVTGHVSTGTAGTISATGSRELGVVTVGVTLSDGNVNKVTPVISKATVPSGVVDVSNGAITTDAPSSGKYVAVKANAITRTITATPKVTGAGYGTTSHYNGPASNPTIDAGSNASGTYYVPVASGSATTPTETVDVTVGAPSWDSTNNTFTTTASGSRSITPIVVIGHISAGTAGTISATGSRELGVVTVGVDLSDGNVGKVKPVIAKASVPTGVTDVSNGAITITAPSSGNYVAVSAAAIARTITAAPKVTAAGYGNTNHYNSPATNPTVDAGSSASGTYYIPVASGSATTPTDTIDITVGTPTWDSTNETFTTTASGSKSITPTVTAGYLPANGGTAGTISAAGSRTLGVVTVGASLTGNVAKVTPVISKTSVPSGVIDAANGAATKTAPASGTVAIAVSTAAVARTVTGTPSVTAAGYGNTSHYKGPASNPTIDAGANGSGTYYIPIASGSATTPTDTVSATIGDPAWGSNTFTVTASGSKSITPTVTGGYIQANGGTAGTISTSGSKNLGVVTVGADLTGNVAKVTPVISKTSVPSGVTDPSDGAATTTAPASGTIAIAVSTAAIARTVTGTPKVTGAGYGTTAHYNGPATNPTIDAGANASGTYYIPVKKGTADATLASVPSGKTNSGPIGYGKVLKLTAGYYPETYYSTSTLTDKGTGSISLSATKLSGSVAAGYYSGGVSASIASTGLTADAASLRSGLIAISAISGSTAKITGSMVDVTPTFQGGASHASGNATVATANGRAIGNDAAGLTLSQTTTDPGSGIYITTGGSISHYRDAVTYKADKTGYLDVDAGDEASAQTAASSSNMGALTYYVTKMTLPKAKAITVVTEANTAADSKALTVTNNAYRTVSLTNAANGTVNISSNSGTVNVTSSGTVSVTNNGTASVTNNASKTTTITNSGTTTVSTNSGTVTVSSNSGIVSVTSGISGSTTQGTLNVKAYPSSGTTIESTTRTIVSGGRWYEPTVSAPGTFYGKVTVPSTNISAGNIKTGVAILGTTGTFTSDATAAAGDILSGKTAYVNGSKVTGSLANVASTTVSNVFTVYQEFTANSPVTASTLVASAPTAGSIRVTGGIAATGGIKGSQVYNAVWNDLADAIPVNEDADLEYGYCYCFDGEKYYKSSKYLDDGIIGIHSDTAGFVMGTKGTCKEMQVAVAGFVLAYVDKEYLPGTLLTCTENGYLTEISKQDKLENPEKIVASFWKPETRESWGSEERQVIVNGRMWVKIR